MANTSYYLYQKYEQRGNQDPIPVYPNIYSVNGDGTMPLVVKSNNDPNCGYVPPAEPIYRWTNIDISTDYYCDVCPFASKFKATYSGGTTYSAACDSNTTITSADTTPSGYDYSAMTSVEIGNCITNIGDNAFNNDIVNYCKPSNLSSVTLHSSVTSVGKRGFYDNEKLKTIIGWNQLTTLDEFAFYNCRSLENSDIPSGLTSIEKYVFWCNFKLMKATIPSGITSIGSDAFGGCSGLTSVTIPDSVTTIGDGAFAGCYSLTDVTIPSGVTTIDAMTFEDCHSLTSVTIPSGVTSIINRAFEGCSGLTSITCLATTPPTINVGADSVFDNTNNCPIYVPSSSVNAYKTADGWGDYASRIQAIP